MAVSFVTVSGGGGGGFGVKGRFLIVWGDSGSGASFRREDCDDLPGASLSRDDCDERRRGGGARASGAARSAGAGAGPSATAGTMGASMRFRRRRSVAGFVYDRNRNDIGRPGFSPCTALSRVCLMKCLCHCGGELGYLVRRNEVSDAKDESVMNLQLDQLPEAMPFGHN